jgi:AcrR family transcriptional regulator
VERGNRTRRAIVEAHVALLREGDLLPTAARVAERAGVSVRTLWGAFGDMEGLLRATAGHWFELDDALRGDVDPAAPLATRIEQFCAERVRRLENISPAARAALLKEPFSEALRASRLGHVERVVHDIEAAFAPELDAAPDRPALLDALVAATSWNAWSLLRDDLDRPVDAAHTAMLTTLRALLPPQR